MIRPFPTHVPTLTEVVEVPPVPEPKLAEDDAVVSDFVVAEAPVDVLQFIPGDDKPVTAPALAHNIAVLTEVVSESEVLPEPAAEIDPTTTATVEEGSTDSSATTMPSGGASSSTSTFIPEAKEPPQNLPSVDALLDDTSNISQDSQVVAAAEATDLSQGLVDALTEQITENLSTSLTPVIEGLADQLMRNLQTELNQRLKLMVAQAISQELSKRRPS